MRCYNAVGGEKLEHFENRMKERMRRQPQAQYHRLIWVLVVAVGLYVGAKVFVGKMASRPAPSRTSQVEPPPITTQGKEELREEVVPSPEVEKFSAEDLLEVKDGTTRIEAKALWALFSEALKLPRVEKGTDVVWSDLKSSPVKYRGMLVRIRGTIYRMGQRELAKNILNLSSIWWGIMGDEQRNLFAFYLTEKPRGFVVNDKAVVNAYFLKSWLYQKEEFKSEMMVIVGRNFEPPSYLNDPSVLDTVVEGNRPEMKPLNYLISLVRRTPFSEGKKKAQDVPWLELVNDPEEYRGKFVRLDGQLLLCKPVVPDFYPDPELKKIYWGLIIGEKFHIFTFYALSKPKELVDRQPVRLYGAFLKNWTYTARNNVEQISPVVVTRYLVPVERTGIHPFVYVVTAVLVVTIALLGLGAYLDRRGERVYRELRRKLREDEQGKS